MPIATQIVLLGERMKEKEREREKPICAVSVTVNIYAAGRHLHDVYG